MKHAKPFAAIACLALAAGLCSSAQEKGYWHAASTNASAITGDIAFSDRGVSINLLSFPAAQIRDLTQAEATAAFDADPNAAGAGHLYRLNIPAARRFLHKNTLCGTEDTQWAATYISGRTLQVAFFSGSGAPTLTFEALSKSTDLCGIFTYSR